VEPLHIQPPPITPFRRAAGTFPCKPHGTRRERALYQFGHIAGYPRPFAQASLFFTGRPFTDANNLGCAKIFYMNV
jgi:hypothetical protein